MEKTVFGLTYEQIERQCSKEHSVDPEFKSRPLNTKEYLEPCLRGAKKILSSPNKKALFYRIYRK